MKDERLDQRLTGLESMIRKRIEVHLQSHEDRLQAVIEDGREFRFNVRRQIEQLDDAIQYPQVREVWTNKTVLSDLIT